MEQCKPQRLPRIRWEHINKGRKNCYKSIVYLQVQYLPGAACCWRSRPRYCWRWRLRYCCRQPYGTDFSVFLVDEEPKSEPIAELLVSLGLIAIQVDTEVARRATIEEKNQMRQAIDNEDHWIINQLYTKTIIMQHRDDVKDGTTRSHLATLHTCKF